MTQIGSFTAVYDMLNLQPGMPASLFGRLGSRLAPTLKATRPKHAFHIFCMFFLSNEEAIGVRCFYLQRSLATVLLNSVIILFKCLLLHRP